MMAAISWVTQVLKERSGLSDQTTLRSIYPNNANNQAFAVTTVWKFSCLLSSRLNPTRARPPRKKGATTLPDIESSPLTPSQMSIGREPAQSIHKVGIQTAHDGRLRCLLSYLKRQNTKDVQITSASCLGIRAYYRFNRVPDRSATFPSFFLATVISFRRACNPPLLPPRYFPSSAR